MRTRLLQHKLTPFVSHPCRYDFFILTILCFDCLGVLKETYSVSVSINQLTLNGYFQSLQHELAGNNNKLVIVLVDELFTKASAKNRVISEPAHVGTATSGFGLRNFGLVCSAV